MNGWNSVLVFSTSLISSLLLRIIIIIIIIIALIIIALTMAVLEPLDVVYSLAHLHFDVTWSKCRMVPICVQTASRLSALGVSTVFVIASTILMDC